MARKELKLNEIIYIKEAPAFAYVRHELVQEFGYTKAKVLRMTVFELVLEVYLELDGKKVTQYQNYRDLVYFTREELYNLFTGVVCL